MQQWIINGSEKGSGLCPVELQAMELALKAAGAEAVTTVFCDDSTRNVSGGHAAGMFSVLVSHTLPMLHACLLTHSCSVLYSCHLARILHEKNTSIGIVASSKPGWVCMQSCQTTL